MVDEIIKCLDFYIRPLFFIVGTSLALYLGWQKIGNKVSAQVKTSMSNFHSEWISNLTIKNERDRPLNIYSVYAVFHNDYKIELDKYQTPKILKPYENLSISLPPYSLLKVGSDIFLPPLNRTEFSIYLDTGHSFIKCKTIEYKNSLNHFKLVSKDIFNYNNHVYTENVAFILSYQYENKILTAFIHKGGYIGNEWGFTPNYIGNNVTEHSIKNMLIAYNFDPVFSHYKIIRVDFPNLETVIEKNNN